MFKNTKLVRSLVRADILGKIQKKSRHEDDFFCIGAPNVVSRRSDFGSVLLVSIAM